MVSQVCTAGGSLILQLIAARTLGLAGYGAFALCLGLLTNVSAFYTAFVGDGLTVLNRQERLVRQGLATCAVIILLLCSGAAIALVPLLHLGSVAMAAMYALLVGAWLLEETGRRVMMARLEFWRLVANDALYAVVTLLTLLTIVLAGARLSLFVLLASMAVGALAAIVVARLQLPSTEYRRAGFGLGGIREVCRFSVWRSLQASLIPAQLLAARVTVLQLASITAVGAVEAGRLVVAPIQTVINGAGSFLLPSAAERERNLHDDSRRLAERAVVVLVGLTVVGGCLAALLSNPLGRLMTGRPVSAMLVVGWTLYLTTWSMALPFIAELTARRKTRQVFYIRFADSALGILAVAIGLKAGLSPNLVPALLSTSGVITIVLVRRLAIRSRSTLAGHGGYRVAATANS